MNKILIVEDELKVANFIKQGLEENGFECDVVGDGETGQEIAFQKKHPILILDVNIPKMNGFELLDEFMKLGPDTFANTRIYVVTSSLNEKDRIRSLGYPIVSGFKEKMMDKSQILEILNLK